MIFECLHPSKLPEAHSSLSGRNRQISRVLYGWHAAVSLPSLSDSQTDCQWEVPALCGEDGICSAQLTREHEGSGNLYGRRGAAWQVSAAPLPGT